MIEAETAAKDQIIDPAAAGEEIAVTVDGSSGSRAPLTSVLQHARLQQAAAYVALRCRDRILAHARYPVVVVPDQHTEEAP